MVVEESVNVVFDESNESLERRESVNDDVGLDFSMGRLQIDDKVHQQEEEIDSKKEESPFAHVASPKPGPTQMASPNRNPGTPGLILLFYVLLNFLFQKCRDPNPRPDLNGGSEPELGLLRRFHLSYQNILLIHLVVEAVSVLGKPMIITNSKQFGRPMNINKIHVQRKAFHALFKMIYKNQVSGFNPFVYKTPLVQKMICKNFGVYTYTPYSLYDSALHDLGLILFAYSISAHS